MSACAAASAQQPGADPLLLTRRPELPQVACFDTAFHRGHGAVADHYAIPEHFYREGVRRYGFHGLSYEYVAGRLCEVAPSCRKRTRDRRASRQRRFDVRAGRRKSVESTMGFTALDGLPMGTRSGQIDPGVLLYLMTEKAMARRRSKICSTARADLRDFPASATTCASLRRVTLPARRLRSTILSIASG